MQTIETQLDGRGLRAGIVVARFNHLINRRLLDACTDRLQELGCDQIETMWVPGAFELPLAAQQAAESGRYDALVAIGVVIRGGTPHFDYVCRAVTDGIREVGLATRVPIAFCVLTTDTVEQALDRAARPDEPGVNKGAEAADVVVEMSSLLGQLGKGG